MRCRPVNHAGLKPGVDEKTLRQSLERGTIADCLHAFTPKPGDLVFLPAGTVHAVGGGVFMAEIQQTSDATFRLFDWNRKDAQGRSRQLHVEESFASIHWDQGPIEPIATGDGGRRLVASRYFEIDAVRWPSALTVGGQGRLQALIVTQGQGRFANGEFCMAGDAWILPAAMPALALQVEVPLTGLLCTLPVV